MTHITHTIIVRTYKEYDRRLIDMAKEIENGSEETAIATTLVRDKELAQIFVESGFFSDTKEQSQAIVKILAGKEIGIAPIEAMMGIHIIKGKVELGANVLAAGIKKSAKYDYKVKKHTNTECVIEFYEGEELLGVSEFTIDDAKQAGIHRLDSGWTKYPRNLLFARTISNGTKWFCPDVFGYAPVYVHGEISGVDTDSDGSPIIDVTPKVVKDKELTDEDAEYIVRCGTPKKAVDKTTKEQTKEEPTKFVEYLIGCSYEELDFEMDTAKKINNKQQREATIKIIREEMKRPDRCVPIPEEVNKDDPRQMKFDIKKLLSQKKPNRKAKAKILQHFINEGKATSKHILKSLEIRNVSNVYGVLNGSDVELLWGAVEPHIDKEKKKLLKS